MCYIFKNYEKKIIKSLSDKGLTVSSAESCTGGLISSILTDISGSSDVIKSNFVTYANEAKEKYLFVSNKTLEQFGAVSEQTAKEMAEGLLKQSSTNISIGITGIAGPTGGSKEKPVGLAYIGISDNNKTEVKKILLPKWFPRKFMKFCFAKKALLYLNEFININYGE